MWTFYPWVCLFWLLSHSPLTHCERVQVMTFQEHEEPYLEGIHHYPIILLLSTKRDHHSLFCDDSWHYPNGSQFCSNVNQITQVLHKSKLTDLQENCLRVSILPYFPLVNLKLTDLNDITGYFVDVLDILADLMHFQVVYQMPPDGRWGVKNEDGTWNGMVGELTNNQSDISIGGLSITEDRFQVIDFTHSLIDDDVTLNYRVLEPAELDFEAFFRVFQSGTWICVGVAFIIIVIGLCLTSQMGPNKLGILRCCEITWFNFILRDPNGHDHVSCPSSLFSYKIWFAIMSLFSLFVMTVYTGDLTSKMTASGQVDDLSSFQDMADRNWQLIIWPGTNAYEKMANSPEGTAIQNVFQNHLFDMNRLEHINSTTLREAILKTKHSAHLGSSFFYINYNTIKSVQVPGTWTDQIGFGVPKHWPHLRTMNYHIQRLKEFGILSTLKDKWLKTQIKSSQGGSSSEAFSISFQHTQFPFAFMGVFCAVSCLVGILERVLGKFDSNCSNPW